MEYHGIVSTEFARQSILHSFAFICIHLHSFAILNEILGQRCWHSWRGRAFFFGEAWGQLEESCIFILEKKNLQTFAKDLEDGS